MKLFALEFSKKQQSWHYNFGETEQNTNGFKTIIEFCTIVEAEFLIEYIDIHAKDKNNLSFVFIFKAKDITEKLLYKLLENSISFSRN
jgi:hypothetical protein